MPIRRPHIALLLLLLLVLSALPLEPTLARQSPREKVTAPQASFIVSNRYRVAKLTGEDSINNTNVNYGLFGTDLGIMWDNGQGQLMLAFGDTYGQGWGRCGAGPDQADWRSNTLAISTDTDPQLGLHFSTMIEDKPDHAKELIPSAKLEGIEKTVIPTGGVSIASRNFIYYMSVNRWVLPGMWFTNYGGIAYSDDNGQTWITPDNLKWYNNSASWNNAFQQAALVKEGNYIYLFGAPNGRFGRAYLARVATDMIMDKANYQYWDGSGWQRGNEAAAIPIVNGPLGELSVQYNSYFKRWLMVYLNEDRAAIVLKDAPTLTGPWTEETILVSGSDYPQLYGGFIHPWFNKGSDLYFTMSQWCSPQLSYNVSFMHATLQLKTSASNNA